MVGTTRPLLLRNLVNELKFNIFGWRTKLVVNNEELKIRSFIIKRFGYRPINISLFYEALTHKSHLNIKSPIVPNERLEFLGDTVLDLIIAEFLFKKYPDYEEGELTQAKSNLVNRKTLSKIGTTMMIRDYLRYNHARSINVEGLEGNCLEALIGAIYLDSNYETTKKSVLSHVFRDNLEINEIVNQVTDFKSKLYIWCQRKHLKLEFEVLKEEFNEGMTQYEIVTVINGVNYGVGKDSSKKKAQQKASEETLQLIGED